MAEPAPAPQQQQPQPQPQRQRKYFTVGTVEAKRKYFLNSKQLRTLDHHSEYYGFAAGRASWWYDEQDLLAKAIEVHTKEGLEKKWAKREKLQQRKRQRAQAEAEAASRSGTVNASNHNDADSSPSSSSAASASPLSSEPPSSSSSSSSPSSSVSSSSSSSSTATTTPTAVPRKRVRRRPSTSKKDFTELNSQFFKQSPWRLTVTKPEGCVGTVGEIEVENDYIGNIDFGAPVHSFGNFHGINVKHSLAEKIIKIDTKWKIGQWRFSGLLSVTMKQNPDGKYTLKGKYNSGVPKGLNPVKVVEFTGE